MVDNAFGTSECVPPITAFCFTMGADGLGPFKLQEFNSSVDHRHQILRRPGFKLLS